MLLSSNEIDVMMELTAPPALQQAIEETLTQVRAELMRLYADGDIGTVTVHCGKKQMRVKAVPERIHEPVPLLTE